MKSSSPNIRKAKRLEARANRLWNLNLLNGAWQYALANQLWDQAQALRKAA